MKRRDLLKGSVLLGAGLAGLSFPALATEYPRIEAYRNPGCGCCEKWAGLLTASGFQVRMQDDPELDKRRAAAGVPAEIAGCHTAYLGDYVIEGHVPAEDIIRLLTGMPDIKGLAVSGMPMGSPGMEVAGPSEAYDVLSFKADGTWGVFSSHPAT
jgi:hypothetical protein